MFPLPSSYVQVTVVVPCAVIGKVALCVPVKAPAQLSVAVGADNEVTEHSAVTSDKVAASGTGDSVSPIVIVN